MRKERGTGVAWSQQSFIHNHVFQLSSQTNLFSYCSRMPSRKSGSSETTLADSRRTSLRRLSSIASFPTLFNRRRPNNTTDHTGQSPSSNLSLSSSTVANAPDAGSTDFSTSTRSLLQHEDSISDLPSHPLPTQLPSRRSSYICLPDDPIGGMPRSRTFSNLPLPTRAKKTNSMVPSNSHSRLPSALLPSTRLPSPPTSTRKHSHTRLTSAETKQAPVRNRVKRSDTEPLLAVDAQQRAPSHLPRSTAFKENISLSPIRHLPALDMFHHHENSHDCSSPYHAQRVWKESSSEASEPLLSDSFSSSSPPLSRYAQHPSHPDRPRAQKQSSLPQLTRASAYTRRLLPQCSVCAALELPPRPHYPARTPFHEPVTNVATRSSKHASSLPAKRQLRLHRKHLYLPAL